MARGLSPRGSTVVPQWRRFGRGPYSQCIGCSGPKREGEERLMTSRELEEYRALRDTIRERSTARVWVFLAGLVAWAALTVATAALAALPVATLLPLLILAAAFEAVFSLHVGVERI